MASSCDYLRLLERWAGSAKRHLREFPGRKDLLSFGPGVHGHWALQTHTTAFSAFSELAASPYTDFNRTGMGRDELWDTAFRMLRFTLHGHHSGEGTCVDGEKWGHSWISNLCLERMMHAVENMEPYLTDADWEGLGRVLRSECDWLVDNHPVKAGLVEGNNPENNMWNGCVLWRTSLLFPDAPRAEEYREKGTKFLLNAISFPADAESDRMFAGRPLRDWHVGANFYPSGACDHHRYMNVGYINITLSNLAMLHFSGRHFGWELPEALYLHLEDIWPLTKACVFPDGRLLRIGGDTRVRYCYCQDYAIAAWLLMRDRLGDTDVTAFEDGWLDIVRREQEGNADGSFMGNRLRELEAVSPLYYCRLEGDKAASLSMGASWHRRFREFGQVPVAAEPVKPLQLWSDDYHGSLLAKGEKRTAAWTWIAGEKPMGLCVPSTASDMAEWRYNLSGRILGVGLDADIRVAPVTKELLDGGFVTSGSLEVVSRKPLAEGESEDVIARTQVTCSALPDDGTMIVLQRSRALNRFYFRMVKGLFLNVPNDVFNGGFRRLECAGRKTEMLRQRPGREEILDCGQWLTLDGKLSVSSLNGRPLLLYRSAKPQVLIRSHPESVGGWLYAEEICQGECFAGVPRLYEPKEVLFDVAAAIRVGAQAVEAVPVEVTADGDDVLSGAVRGADGKVYVLVFNASPEVRQVQVAGGVGFELQPGASQLVTL